ncbi:hypothetical protein FRC10_007243 [Ceratobasidium sp. 414]|nr:hypothetical protein FRC10_007243 [Ceratobasidium sp. 414]
MVRSIQLASISSDRQNLVEDLQSADPVPTQSPSESFKSAEQWCEHKMLIIGSSYNGHNRQTSTRLSSASASSPLAAMERDINHLELIFQARGYDVKTMTGGDFDRARVLGEVARFLAPALPGDVRAIVFTGLSDRLGSGPLPMILPGTSSDVIITDRDWDQNIRAHTKPGVTVLSILSTCFAGGFAEQGVQITDFTRPQ